MLFKKVFHKEGRMESGLVHECFLFLERNVITKT
jgi:hypothetical protein